MILSCPAKTFLLGEYVALDGGPSLLLATSPRFQLIVRSSGSAGSAEASPSPFHPESPAGLYFAKHADDLAGWTFEFRDPYQGKGGLGASSAQFALLYAFQNDLQPRGPFDLQKILADYRDVAWNGQGTPPSGADVVTQLVGGITWFDGLTLQADVLKWPFPDLGFSIIRTGVKLATHEHLREGAVAPHSVLRTIVIEARKAFDTADEMRLIESVNAGSLALRQSGLTAPATTDLLDQMRDNHELFWAAKGCGAMGADMILVLHPKARTNDVAAWAKGRGLDIAASLENLTSGLEILQEGQA